MNQESLNVPTRLNDPPKVLFWDLDVFLLAGTFFSFGIVTKNIITLTAIGLFLTWKWMQLKSGKHQWFMIHGAQWFLPGMAARKRTPDPSIREWMR